MGRINWRNAHCMGSIVDGDETSKTFGRSCRGNISPLYWRIPILLWSVVIITWSVCFFWGSREKFFIYMTHWGLMIISLESLFGIIVTVRKTRQEKSDATFGLPWYVKTYWVLYNIAIPVSFLVSGFYWGLLRSKAGNMDYFTPNPVLDVMLHGINSAVMLVELISSAHPSRLLHIMQPLMFAGVYLLFTVIYFYAGGHDPWGHEYIYPVMDWNKPRETIVVAALSGLFLALMHIVVVAISTLRDVIARRFLRDVNGVYNNAFSA
ncbi:protein rolling stone-like [Achroia grisella]|uniref:protein rolling stone-like n=1 Tax=Achroia grisella TaxID=688607 RepID=UPI0027D2FC8E|nr:protein rolling stone-like [Achroia grisella]